MAHSDLASRWFTALNEGDLNRLLSMFVEAPRIRNAGKPSASGPEVARNLLEDFFQRTASRTSS